MLGRNPLCVAIFWLWTVYSPLALQNDGSVPKEDWIQHSSFSTPSCRIPFYCLYTQCTRRAACTLKQIAWGKILNSLRGGDKNYLPPSPPPPFYPSLINPYFFQRNCGKSRAFFQEISVSFLGQINYRVGFVVENKNTWPDMVWLEAKIRLNIVWW